MPNIFRKRRNNKPQQTTQQTKEFICYVVSLGEGFEVWRGTDAVTANNHIDTALRVFGVVWWGDTLDDVWYCLTSD